MDIGCVESQSTEKAVGHLASNSSSAMDIIGLLWLEDLKGMGFNLAQRKQDCVGVETVLGFGLVSDINYYPIEFSRVDFLDEFIAGNIPHRIKLVASRSPLLSPPDKKANRGLDPKSN